MAKMRSMAYILQPTLYNLSFTLFTYILHYFSTPPLFTWQFTFSNWHFTIYILTFTNYSLHSTFYPFDSTLNTQHSSYYFKSNTIIGDCLPRSGKLNMTKEFTIKEVAEKKSSTGWPKMKGKQSDQGCQGNTVPSWLSFHWWWPSKKKPKSESGKHFCTSQPYKYPENL